MSLKNAVSRRSFLKGSAVAGGGLVVSFFVPTVLRRFAFAQEPPPAAPAALPPVNAFLRIGEDESVTVLLAHSEMGQGIWTTLPMMVNEELDADWSHIRVEHAPAAPVYHSPVFPIQMTGGSTTTWSELDRYRQVGAVARTLLVSAAAAQWDVAPGDCHTEKGWVISGGKRASYGSLATAASKLPAPAKVALKDPADWKVIGKPTRRLDTPEKITGRAQVRHGRAAAGDADRGGGASAAPSAARCKGFDDAAAKAVPGRARGVRGPLRASRWSPIISGRPRRGGTRSRSTGTRVRTPDLDTASLRESYRKTAKSEGDEGRGRRRRGEGARRRRAANAAGGGVRAPLPRARSDGAAQLHGAPRRRPVRAVDGDAVPDGGPAAGGGDLRPQARAGDDPHHVPRRRLRAAGEHRLGLRGRGGPRGEEPRQAGQGGVDARGRHPRRLLPADGGPPPGRGAGRGGDAGGLAAAHRLAVDRGRLAVRRDDQGRHRSDVGRGGVRFPLRDGAARITASTCTLTDPGVPVLWWRSVGHSHTAFAVESFVDELAHAARKDPLEFRRALLAKSPRVRAVLELAAEKAGWGTPPPAGRARGLAVHESFGSIVSHVAEVSVEDGRIRVHRVTCAVDCGVCVNPLGRRGADAVGGRLRAHRGAPRRADDQGRPGRRRATSTITRSCGCTRCRRSRSTSFRATRSRAAPASPARRRSRPRWPTPSSR